MLLLLGRRLAAVLLLLRQLARLLSCQPHQREASVLTLAQGFSSNNYSMQQKLVLLVLLLLAGLLRGLLLPCLSTALLESLMSPHLLLQLLV